MGFLAPWFLAGIAAIGLPIWIHLLKRHRTDPKLFPSLMLFEKREQSSVKHRRLEHILLFALRALMILLIALLFANPFIKRSVTAADSKHITVIAVDRSFSMRAGNHFQQAKDEANSVLSSVKAGEQAQVVALGATVQAMTQPTSNTPELRAAIAAIDQSDSRASFGELARYTHTLEESIKMPIELHLISDLQNTAMPPFADMRLDPQTKLVPHQIGKAEPNFAVESVVAPRRVYDPKHVRVVATVRGFDSRADAPAAKKTVTMLLNGKVLQSKPVDVPANSRATVEFLGLDAPYGFSKGEMRVDGGDTLAADDRYLFSVERRDPGKVGFIDSRCEAARDSVLSRRPRCIARGRVSGGIHAPRTRRGPDAFELQISGVERTRLPSAGARRCPQAICERRRVAVYLARTCFRRASQSAGDR